MDVTVIKKPFEISFDGNPIVFVFGISPYGVQQQKQDIKLQIKVLVESGFGSNVFIEQKNNFFYPDSKGKVTVDVSSVIKVFTKYFTPKLSLNTALALTTHRIKFKIAYILTVDNVIKVNDTLQNVFTSIKGGLSYDKFHPTDFFNIAVVANKQPLNFYTAGEKVGIEEKKFLYWLYPYADFGQQMVEFIIYYEDDTIEYYVINSANAVVASQWTVCLSPIGYNMIASRAAAKNKLIVAYTVRVKVGATIICQTPLIKIDYRVFYRTKQLFYRNSLGALESIRLNGQIDFETDYESQQAQLAVPPIYYREAMLMPHNVQSVVYEKEKYTGFTGFLNKELLEKTRDLFISTERYCEENEQLKPIIVNGRNTKFYNNKENLAGIQVDFEMAYVNEYFTPKNLLPTTRACPLVESLSVKQLNVNTLLIFYSLPIPYHICNIETIINGVTLSYTFNGNNDIIKLPFINPVAGTTNTATITIRARVICDENAIPVDAGAFTARNIQITGSSGLIAQNDSYSINNGFNSAIALNGSVLTNDSDPDGNTLEVVANAGATTNGGSYSINAAGNITYTPPSSNFIGTDTFTYTIRRVNTTSPTAIATVTINVGAGSNTIYVKIVDRNINSSSSGGTGGQYFAEVFLEFFSNVGGTNSLDVTGLNLVVTVERIRRVNNVQVDGEIISVNATGTSIKVGEKQNVWEYNFSTNEEDTDYTDFTILPGAGYVII